MSRTNRRNAVVSGKPAGFTRAAGMAECADCGWRLVRAAQQQQQQRWEASAQKPRSSLGRRPVRGKQTSWLKSGAKVHGQTRKRRLVQRPYGRRQSTSTCTCAGPVYPRRGSASAFEEGSTCHQAYPFPPISPKVRPPSVPSSALIAARATTKATRSAPRRATDSPDSRSIASRVKKGLAV